MKCFDCGTDDWMNKFHHTENRSFCDECHKKRIQPERLSEKTRKGSDSLNTTNK